MISCQRLLSEHGIDHNETFSPVVRFSSIRTLLAFAMQNDILIDQMDVLSAFLNGELEEETYAARWLHSTWQRRSGLQIEKISLWFEAVSKMSEQSI